MRSIYFMQAVDGGPIKIGLSGDPASRLRAVQTTSPVELELLAEIPGSVEMERKFHDWFAPGRLHGEWFSEETPALAELIELIIAPDLTEPGVAEVHRLIAEVREQRRA